MKKVKLSINADQKIILASAYALAMTAIVFLLLLWSRAFAILLVFLIIFELTFLLLHLESYNKNDRYKDD